MVRQVLDDKCVDIITAKKRNKPIDQIKKRFNISERTISQIWNKYQKTGSHKPKPCKGRKSKLTKQQDQQSKTP